MHNAFLIWNRRVSESVPDSCNKYQSTIFPEAPSSWEKPSRQVHKQC